MDTGVEDFERGDVVAILSDGTVTHTTSDPDVEFFSVVPGSVSDQLSPWKTLPDPAPEPIEDFQLVSLLGMVYIRVKDSSVLRDSASKDIRNNFVIIPDSQNIGCGKLVTKAEYSENKKSACYVVGIPFDNNVLPSNDGYLVLCMRSGDTVRALLDALRKKDNNSLASLQEEQQNEMDNLSKQVKQLGLDFKQHLDVHDSDSDPILTQFTEDLTNVSCDNSPEKKRKLVKIPNDVPHVELYPLSYSDKPNSFMTESLPNSKPISKASTKIITSLLSSKKVIGALENTNGEILSVTPYTSTFQIKITQQIVLSNIILFDRIAKNLECQTYAIQKRDCFEKSDISQLKENHYTQKLSGVFFEIYIQNRLILRIMRVVRISDSQKMISIIPLGEIYRCNDIQLEETPIASQHQSISNTFENGESDAPKNKIPKSERTSFHQMLKNGQWNDVCLYVTSDKFAPELLEHLVSLFFLFF